MIRKLLRQFGIFAGIACTFYASGCASTAKMSVTNYPGFFSNPNSYGSIAVGEVRNSVEPGRFDREVSAELVGDLYNNGFYQVFDYTNEPISDSQLISTLREHNVSDLVVYGTITDYGEYRYEQTRYDEESRPVFKEDEDGNLILDEDGDPIVDYYETIQIPYTWFIRETNANMLAVVREVQSGKMIYSREFSYTCDDAGRNPHNFRSPHEALWCALSNLTGSIVYQISPTNEVITVKLDETLSILRYNAKKDTWNDEDSFSSDETIRLRVFLPNAAYYNRFAVEIVAEDDTTALTHDDIYWEGKNTVFDYNISDLLIASGGKTKFHVRFLQGKKIVFEREFKVK